MYFSSQSQAPPPRHALPGAWGLFFSPRLKKRLHITATWQHHLPPGWRHLARSPAPWAPLPKSSLPGRRGPCRHPRGPRLRVSSRPSPEPYLPSPAGPRRSPGCRLQRSSCRLSESPRAARRPGNLPFPLGLRQGPSYHDGRRPAGGPRSERAPAGSAARPQSWREGRGLPRRRLPRAVSQRTAPAPRVPSAQARRQPRRGVT